MSNSPFLADLQYLQKLVYFGVRLTKKDSGICILYMILQIFELKLSSDFDPETLQLLQVFSSTESIKLTMGGLRILPTPIMFTYKSDGLSMYNCNKSLE